MNFDLMNAVVQYHRHFATESEKTGQVAGFIRTATHPTSRGNMSGHITASGVVLENDHILLIRHPALQRWLQPGGHIDPNETPDDAAIREVAEETGLPVVLDAWHRTNRMPLDIDIHPIPASSGKNEGEHLHFDFRYLLRAAPATSPCMQRAPELDCRWWPIDSNPAKMIGGAVFKAVNIRSASVPGL